MTPEMGPLLRTLHKTVAPRHPCRWSSIQRRGRLQAPRLPAPALPMTLRFWKCGGGKDRSAESVRVPSGRILCGSHLQFRADPRRRLGRPLLIGISDRSPFALTGLLERWRNLKAGEAMQTFAIITTPNEICSLNGSAKRTRMPTLLPAIRREPAFD